MTPARHFTATGFVIDGDKVLLHWHPKVKAWLPPGGHIDENEDPVQAALREIEEETGVRAEVVPTGPSLDLDYPTQVASPYTIMVEDIHDPVDGYHQHIDMIYFCRPAGLPGQLQARPLNDGWLWVEREALTSETPLQHSDSPSEPPPEDVRLLALRAFEVVGATPPL